MARVSLARDNVHTWPTGSTGSGAVPWAVRRLEWAWGSWRGRAAREERISQHVESGDSHLEDPGSWLIESDCGNQLKMLPEHPRGSPRRLRFRSAFPDV